MERIFKVVTERAAGAGDVVEGAYDLEMEALDPIGAEIIARVSEQAHGALSAPPLRITPPFAPSPFAPVLEKAYLPNAGARGIGPRLRMVPGRRFL